AIQAITHQRDYLPTIFPYRGDAWGTWSQVTYLNQRHFASAIGILLVVFVFIVMRYRAVAAKRAESRASAGTAIDQLNGSPDIGGILAPDNPLAPADVREPQVEIPAVPVATEPRPGTAIAAEPFLATIRPFIFSGVLLGLLPMLNSAVFLAAAAVLGVLFFLFSLRGQMLVLAITAGVVALPQMLYLSTGSGRAHMPKLP